MERTFEVEIGYAYYEGDAQVWDSHYSTVKLPKEDADRMDADGTLSKNLFETAEQAFLANTEELVAGTWHMHWDESTDEELEFDCE